MQARQHSSVSTPGDRESLAEAVDATFAESASATRRALIAGAEVRAFQPRQTVLAQGDESRVGLVLEGYVGLRRTTVDGREVITLVLSRGRVAPFMPFAGRPSTADLLALSAGRIALWPGGDVTSIAAGDPTFATSLLRHVILTVEEVVERMDGLLYQNALQRVARVLDQHAAIVFGDAPVVPRTYLPALVGTSREMTGRVLRLLESEGVVERIGRDRLRLLDRDRLTSIAAPASRAPATDRRNKFLAAPRRAVQE